MKKSIILIALVFSCFSISCLQTMSSYALYKDKDFTEGTQLQLREIQQKIYDTDQTELVLKAVLNVLQDDGYDVENLDFGAGYLNGVKESQRRIPEKMVTVKDIIKATVNVSVFGSKTKVRANFHYRFIQPPKPANPHELEYESTEIYDPQFYQDFFNKVDKAIFIEKQKL
jgi:hypothetical protein